MTNETTGGVTVGWSALLDQLNPDKQVDRLRATEPPDMRRLRWLLAIVYAGARLYRDDGEYSDSASGIDFRRDSVAEIEAKMTRYGARLMKSNAGLQGRTREAGESLCKPLLGTNGE